MSVRSRLVLVVFWVASLIVVAAFAAAQTKMNRLPSPLVLSGADVGFRVEGKVGNTPAGTLVIRVNGEWIEPVTPTGPARLGPTQ